MKVFNSPCLNCTLVQIGVRRVYAKCGIHPYICLEAVPSLPVLGEHEVRDEKLDPDIRVGSLTQSEAVIGTQSIKMDVGVDNPREPTGARESLSAARELIGLLDRSSACLAMDRGNHFRVQPYAVAKC